MIAPLANLAWAAWNRPAHAAFIAALKNPQQAQAAVLKQYLRKNADTAFGREHRFDRIASPAAFARRVPAREYDALSPWIDRIAAGESNVLTAEPVRRFAVTSGSTRARKLIPQTRGLQREFNRAIGPWIVDLFLGDRPLMNGCAYWSVTPPGRPPPQNPAGPPVGFDEDSEYLGGVAAKLVDAAMAVPASVARLADMGAFRRATLRHLLGRADLRLISVWHPSFLTLLLDTAVAEWADLAAALPRLRPIAPGDWRRVWPGLKLVSCWADAHAAGPAAALADRIPGVRVQPKGLLLTEAFVTIPFAGRHPLAVRSHYFEFECDGGKMLPAHDLQIGGEYRPIVTTAGGLYRCRLGDRVRCDGLVGRTPSLRFLGRADAVVDRFGEKLNEHFVGAAIRRVLADSGVAADFAMLAPAGGRYALHLCAAAPPSLAGALDAALCTNPHYAHCRALGQLGPVRVVRVGPDAYEKYAAAQVAAGRRLGDIKATALSGVPWGAG